MTAFNFKENQDEASLYIFSPKDFWGGHWQYNTFKNRRSAQDNPKLRFFTRGEYLKYCSQVPSNGDAMGLLSKLKLDH